MNRKATVVEWACIFVCAGLVWFLEPWFPRRLPVGEILLYGSALLLFQGLVRDLYLKYLAPKPVACDVKSKGKCLCMESTIGSIGIAAGVLILLSMGMRRTIHLPAWAWPAIVVVIGTIGFCVREFVIDWKAGKLRRGLDHRVERAL